MSNFTLDNNIENRLRRYPHVQSVRGRVNDNIRRSPRRFHPTTPDAPGVATPLANPYSRRPSAISYITEVMAIRNNIQPPGKTPASEIPQPKRAAHYARPNISPAHNIASNHHPVRSAVLRRQAVKSPHENSP